ncbi:hypothetical protein ACSMXN_14390 [Jatrophihabitans sp. DSM 45814]
MSRRARSWAAVIAVVAIIDLVATLHAHRDGSVSSLRIVLGVAVLIVAVLVLTILLSISAKTMLHERRVKRAYDRLLRDEGHRL